MTDWRGPPRREAAQSEESRAAQRRNLKSRGPRRLYYLVFTKRRAN